MRARANLRCRKRAGGGGNRLGNLFDRWRLRHSGQVLRGIECRYRPLCRPQSASNPGNRRDAHNDHFQGLLKSRGRFSGASRSGSSPIPIPTAKWPDFKMRLSLSLALVALASAANAAETETAFLFDALHGKTPYRASWEKLMKLVQPTPDWLIRFNRNFDGVAGQMTNLTVNGKPYEISFVCKPADCERHKF